MSFDTDSGREHDFSSGGGDDLTGVISGREKRDPGLGLLLELAKRGEYDPWDIDIVALTDRYLAALDDHLDARDLGHVARLIFYAAALVHLKAQALAEREARIRREESFDATLDAQMSELADQLRYGRGLLPGDQPLVYPDWMADGSHDGGGVDGLMPRERRPRDRGLTLVDLIAALRSYDEKLLQREAELANQEAYDELATHEECVSTSHQDDLDRDIIGVRKDLWQKLALAPQVRFEELHGAERSKAGAYLALLFLAQDEEVVLDQKTCYGELLVGRGTHFGEIRAGVRTEDSEDVVDAAEPEADEVEADDAEDAEDDEAGELCEVEGGEGVQA